MILCAFSLVGVFIVVVAQQETWSEFYCHAWTNNKNETKDYESIS